MPIPFAVALGLYIPPFVPVDFALGALARTVWRARSPASFEQSRSSVAAGMISGEGFAAVCVALFEFFTGISYVWQLNYDHWY
jgi:uncharacterized oligopeptide transporter (OPT) family protein